MAHANNGVPSGSQSMFGKLLGLATGRTGQAAYPQNQAYSLGAQDPHLNNPPYQAGFPYAQPQDNHGYQQGSQSHGMQQMHPVQGHPQTPLRTTSVSSWISISQPQGNHGYQQGSQSYGMQQMHPVQGHPQPLPNGYAPGPHQAPAAGWAQPGESTGQYSHGADPYYGHGTNNGERYTGHEGGFNKHSGGGYSH